MSETEPGFDINDAADTVLNEYSNRMMKLMIQRCEQLRLGTYVPSQIDAEILIKCVNQWLTWFVGEEARTWHYKLRETGGTYQVYQDALREDKPKKKRKGGDRRDDRDGPDYSEEGGDDDLHPA